MLKINLYTWNGWILWYVNYISKKLLKNSSIAIIASHKKIHFLLPILVMEPKTLLILNKDLLDSILPPNA